jgi:hypothetical protein
MTTWSEEFDLEGGNEPRSWKTRYTGSRNGPKVFPPGKSVNITVKVPLYVHAMYQKVADDPRYGYGGSVPALMRDATPHRIMELVEHMTAGEVSPEIETIVRRLQQEHRQAERQAFWDHVEAQKEAAKRDLDRAKGRVPLEEIEKIVADYRQDMENEAWNPMLVAEMEQILVPAETAANNPLRSVK